MKHVEQAASKVGIDHVYIPPHQQSLNEAENVADQMWAAARAHILHSNAPDKLFGKAVDFPIYSDIRTTTTANRGWLTPYEIVRGSPPSIAKMHVFFTKAFVVVPKSKRKALAAKGPGFGKRGALGSLLLLCHTFFFISNLTKSLNKNDLL